MKKCVIVVCVATMWLIQIIDQCIYTGAGVFLLFYSLPWHDLHCKWFCKRTFNRILYYILLIFGWNKFKSQGGNRYKLFRLISTEDSDSIVISLLYWYYYNDRVLEYSRTYVQCHYYIIIVVRLTVIIIIIIYNGIIFFNSGICMLHVLLLTWPPKKINFVKI